MPDPWCERILTLLERRGMVVLLSFISALLLAYAIATSGQRYQFVKGFIIDTHTGKIENFNNAPRPNMVNEIAPAQCSTEYAIMCGMRTMNRPATLDLALAQKADRKLRRYGSDLNSVLSVIVTIRGVPQQFRSVSPIEESLAESAGIASGERPGNFRPVAQFLSDMHALCAR